MNGVKSADRLYFSAVTLTLRHEDSSYLWDILFNNKKYIMNMETENYCRLYMLYKLHVEDEEQIYITLINNLHRHLQIIFSKML